MIKSMKAAILAVVLILAPLSAAQADNDIGCGVGTEIFKGKSGAFQKLLASWTNGITFQSISITFGLVNCGKLGDTITASAATRHFVATSLDNLAADVAMGGGESLDALSALLEVAPADRGAFGAFAQSHYDVLFPTAQVTSDEMLESLDRLMRQDARFEASAPSAHI